MRCGIRVERPQTRGTHALHSRAHRAGLTSAPPPSACPKTSRHASPRRRKRPAPPRTASSWKRSPKRQNWPSSAPHSMRSPINAMCSSWKPVKPSIGRMRAPGSSSGSPAKAQSSRRSGSRPPSGAGPAGACRARRSGPDRRALASARSRKRHPLRCLVHQRQHADAPFTCGRTVRVFHRCVASLRDFARTPGRSPPSAPHPARCRTPRPVRTSDG